MRQTMWPFVTIQETSLSSDHKQRAVKTLEQFEVHVLALCATAWVRDTVMLPYVFDFPHVGR